MSDSAHEMTLEAHNHRVQIEIAGDQALDWYHEGPPQLSDEALTFFHAYPPTRSLSPELKDPSDPSSSPLVQHILTMRSKAWNISPFPCIGSFRFVNPTINSCSRYVEILQRLIQGNQHFLDLGCCVGQDVRKLVTDGAPPANILGADLHQGFIDLGYELFLDGPDTAAQPSHRLLSTFIVGDVFDPAFLQDLKGTFDIINIGSFLHLFSLDLQKKAATRIAEFLSNKTGSLIVGKQMGNPKAVEVDSRRANRKIFLHDPESFKEFWQGIGEGKWKVDVEFYSIERSLPTKLMMLFFVVQRL